MDKTPYSVHIKINNNRQLSTLDSEDRRNAHSQNYCTVCSCSHAGKLTSLLDSHKLIRWRLATHGGIDGYSRLIVYLKCMSNIKSTTIYESFIGAVREYHLPSRVRSDQGGENVLIAQHMIEQRGPDRGSMIVGSSVHNQRIERMWKDMHKCVTSLYYRLFYFMEQCDLLNPLDEKHIYALHYIFTPRINRALAKFTHGWNHHPIHTAHNKSPHQLFTAGMLLLRHSGLIAIDFFMGSMTMDQYLLMMTTRP